MAIQDEDIEAKIHALMKQGSEHEKLDYKRKLDISTKADCVEIAKDIGAMLSSGGGSILVGVDDDGKPSQHYTDEIVSSFDEAKFRTKLKAYIAEPINITTHAVKIKTNNFLLIDCGAYPSGFVVFKSDGQYEGSKGMKLAFRKGDVYVRHGSASERWEQHDIRRIIDTEMSKRKAEWLKEAEMLFSRMSGGRTLEIAEQSNRLNEIYAELKTKLSNNTLNISDIKTSLDEICFIAIKATRSDQEDLFKEAVKRLNDVYNFGFNSHGNWQMDRRFKPEHLWYEVLIRIPIVGGICMSEQKYDYAKVLSLQKLRGDEGRHYSNWYRHAQVMSYRSDLFGKGGNVISSAINLVTSDSRFGDIIMQSEDDMKTEFSRFDYLACVFAIDEMQAVDYSYFYPSFSYFNKDRINQLLIDIILNDDLRKKLFKSSDENLAFIIKELDRIASKESFGWHAGEWRYGIEEFISKAAPFNK